MPETIPRDGGKDDTKGNVSASASEQVVAAPSRASDSPERLYAKPTEGRWVLGRTVAAQDGEWIEFENRSRHFLTSKGLPLATRHVQEGDLYYQAATDPDGLRLRFESDPGAIALQILRQNRLPISKRDVEGRLQELFLEPPKDWWQRASKEFRSSRHVISKPGGKYLWSDEAVVAQATAHAGARRPRPRAVVAPAQDAALGELESEPTVPPSGIEGLSPPEPTPPALLESDPSPVRQFASPTQVDIAAPSDTPAVGRPELPPRQRALATPARRSIARDDLAHLLDSLVRATIGPNVSPERLLDAALRTTGEGPDADARFAFAQPVVVLALDRLSGTSAEVVNLDGDVARRLVDRQLPRRRDADARLRQAIVTYLDRSGRVDLLRQDGVWAGLTLRELKHPSVLMDVILRHDLLSRVVTPLVLAAIDEQAEANDVVDLLALPAATSDVVPINKIAAKLERLQNGSSTLANVLLQYRARAVAGVADEVHGTLVARMEALQAELASEREQLETERSRRAQVVLELKDIRREARSSATHELQLARLQTLQVVAGVLEAVRIAASAGGTTKPSGVFDRALEVASGEGVRIDHLPGETVPYDPQRQRVIGAAGHVAAGDPVLIVRPTYLMSQGGVTIVIAYGEVRPTSS